MIADFQYVHILRKSDAPAGILERLRPYPFWSILVILTMTPSGPRVSIWEYSKRMRLSPSSSSSVSAMASRSGLHAATLPSSSSSRRRQAMRLTTTSTHPLPFCRFWMPCSSERNAVCWRCPVATGQTAGSRFRWIVLSLEFGHSFRICSRVIAALCYGTFFERGADPCFVRR